MFGIEFNIPNLHLCGMLRETFGSKIRRMRAARGLTISG
jgi:hypothetical protein